MFKQAMLRAEGTVGAKALRQEKATPLEELKAAEDEAMGNEAGRPQPTQDLDGPGEDLGFCSGCNREHWVVFILFCFVFKQVSELLQSEF